MGAARWKAFPTWLSGVHYCAWSRPALPLRTGRVLVPETAAPRPGAPEAFRFSARTSRPPGPVAAPHRRLEQCDVWAPEVKTQRGVPSAKQACLLPYGHADALGRLPSPLHVLIPIRRPISRFSTRGLPVVPPRPLSQTGLPSEDTGWPLPSELQTNMCPV